MSATKDLFLYQTQLGGIATVSVTHNTGYQSNPYAGNLGLHVHDDTSAVIDRRTTLETMIGKPIQWLNQVHGTAVHMCDSVLPPPTADATITCQTTLALAVMTADCLPVVFTAVDAKGQRAIGIAHAGWRGLLNGVLDQTVRALLATMPNATLHAHLGPCIGLAHFEIGSEVRTAFLASTPDSVKHFTTKGLGKYLCDLESLARDSLSRLGVRHVSGGGWCTVSDPRLASYRRTPVTGRFATVVALN
jgi:polyphenol oxidase